MLDAIPDERHLVDMIPRIASSDDIVHAVLIQNPMCLYWPEGVAACSRQS